ncbi:MAG TPA: hypothetical protein P5572_05055 [Phycisphaerae bacterium]|nr:hypothetical protein [Phycisphaerae bacterium]
MKTTSPLAQRCPRVLFAGVCAVFVTASVQAAAPPAPRVVDTPYVILACNDLGMHCMNSDFSEMMVLPPFNTLHAQIIRRSGEEPDIITGGVTVRYTIPGNTHGADKSNFWNYWQPIFGLPAPPDFGLAGLGLSGTMSPTGHNDWNAVGIPLVPIDDTGRENPYPLATLTVLSGSTVQARTQVVVPVSTEMSCFICHNTPGISTATDILRAHDRLHGTTLEQQKPVLCASCHADNALGLPGEPGVSNLSAAMHTAHAPRMGPAGNLTEVCYACHPGVRTQCQRDVHLANGMTCTQCHGNMVAVGNPAREPWVDEPRCGTCHARPGFEFEQPNTLYRDSVGHKNVHCYACHGSPHAITPTVTPLDNIQANYVQGHPGTIDTCTVCHSGGPPGGFFHKRDD